MALYASWPVIVLVDTCGLDGISNSAPFPPWTLALEDKLMTTLKTEMFATGTFPLCLLVPKGNTLVSLVS